MFSLYQFVAVFLCCCSVQLCIWTLLSSFFSWLNENWSIYKNKDTASAQWHWPLDASHILKIKSIPLRVVRKLYDGREILSWMSCVSKTIGGEHGQSTREKELARKWRRMVRGELLVRAAVTFQLDLSLHFLKSFYGVSTFTSVCRKSLHFTRYKKTWASRDIF